MRSDWPAASLLAPSVSTSVGAAVRRARAPIGRTPSSRMAAFTTAPPCSYVMGGVSLHPPVRR